MNLPVTDGLTAHYDGRALDLNDGDPVSQWPDLTGGDQHLEETGGNRPIYRADGINGHPAIEFNGSNHRLLGTLNSSIPPPATVVMVLTVDVSHADAQTPWLFGEGAGNTSLTVRDDGHASANQYSLYAGSSLQTDMLAGENQTVVCVINGSSSEVRVDENSDSGNAGSNTLGTSFRVSGRDINDRWLKGYVGEFLIYDRELSAGEIADLENHLEQKWKRQPDTIHPYANLADDPTTKAIIAWVDDDPLADGGEQTLWYGPSEGEPTQSLSVTGQAIPGTDAYVYIAEIADLEPWTWYYGQVQASGATIKTLLPWRTMRSSLAGGGELKIAWVSDTHIDTTDGHGMPDDEQIQPLADVEADLMLFGGDMVTWGDEQNADIGESWLRWWRDYIGRMNKGKLIPILPIPGNHEVGNTFDWDGDKSGSVDPTAGYFQLFFINPKQLAPAGENYGSITIGDYVQFLPLDSHSAFPEDVGEWLGGAIDSAARVCIPFHHSPMFPGGNRHTADLDLQANMREHWAPHLSRAANVFAHFAGHIHVRKRSIPWRIVHQDPGGDNFDLGDGRWLTERAGGIVEFGDGYRKDRTPWSQWYLSHASTSNQFFVLTINEAAFTVGTLDGDGNETHEQVFILPDVLIQRVSDQLAGIVDGSTVVGADLRRITGQSARHDSDGHLLVKNEDSNKIAGQESLDLVEAVQNGTAERISEDPLIVRYTHPTQPDLQWEITYGANPGERTVSSKVE